MKRLYSWVSAILSRLVGKPFKDLAFKGLGLGLNLQPKVQLRMTLPPSQLGLCFKEFICLILIRFRIHYVLKHYLLIAQIMFI